MEILLVRKYKKPTYTVGNLYIDGRWITNTLEDTDRGLKDSMSLNEITSIKQKHITAIPTGTYTITLDIVSPKFGAKQFYKNLCNGKVPRLLNVKGFDGILIHSGNKAEDTDGCILVGRNLEVGKVVRSQETFTKLYKLLKEAKDRKETIQITIE